VIEDYRSPQPGTGRYQPARLIPKSDRFEIALTDENKIQISAAEVLP
jgi:hypothetical protein